MRNDLKGCPIIVVGPQRSGTSTVAGILHNQLGVCMGHNLRPANENNPGGYYEDETIQARTFAFIRKQLHPFAYDTHLRKYAEERATCGVWGFKDPNASRAIPRILSVFPGATLIRCWRPFADILASWKRVYPYPEWHAYAEIERTEDALNKYAPDAHMVKLSDLASDIGKVTEQLRGVVQRATGSTNTQAERQCESQAAPKA